MSNDAFFADNLPKEKTDEYPSLQEGNYLACLGKIYIKARKDGVRQLNLDHILIQRKSLDGTPGEAPFVYTIYENDNLMAKKKPDGTYQLNGIIFSPNFLIDFDIAGVSNKLKGFQTYRKRLIAKCYSALNDETGEIDWTKISQEVGQVVTFQIIKNSYTDSNGNKKTNMDFAAETYTLIPNHKVPLDSVKKIYTEIGLSKQDAQDSPKSNSPKPNDEDLPF